MSLNTDEELNPDEDGNPDGAIINTINIRDLMNRLEKIPGGYVYSGACSYQVCFPLKDGTELRFMLSDDDDDGNLEPSDINSDYGVFNIDLYSGALPPGITGPAKATGGTP